MNAGTTDFSSVDGGASPTMPLNWSFYNSFPESTAKNWKDGQSFEVAPKQNWSLAISPVTNPYP
jgi:hypothetical protein